MTIAQRTGTITRLLPIAISPDMSIRQAAMGS